MQNDSNSWIKGLFYSVSHTVWRIPYTVAINVVCSLKRAVCKANSHQHPDRESWEGDMRRELWNSVKVKGHLPLLSAPRFICFCCFCCCCSLLSHTCEVSLSLRLPTHILAAVVVVVIIPVTRPLLFFPPWCPFPECPTQPTGVSGGAHTWSCCLSHCLSAMLCYLC